MIIKMVDCHFEMANVILTSGNFIIGMYCSASFQQGKSFMTCRVFYSDHHEVCKMHVAIGL